jgi:hypothetical protein
MLKEYPEIHLRPEVKSMVFAAPIFAKRAIARNLNYDKRLTTVTCQSAHKTFISR